MFIDQVYPIWRQRGHRMLSPDHAGTVSGRGCAAPVFLLQMITQQSESCCQTGLPVAHSVECGSQTSALQSRSRAGAWCSDTSAGNDYDE